MKKGLQKEEEEEEEEEREGGQLFLSILFVY